MAAFNNEGELSAKIPKILSLNLWSTYMWLEKEVNDKDFVNDKKWFSKISSKVKKISDHQLPTAEVSRNGRKVVLYLPFLFLFVSIQLASVRDRLLS